MLSIRYNKTISILVAAFFLIILITDFHFKVVLYHGLDSVKYTKLTKLIIGGVLAYLILKEVRLKQNIIIALLILLSSFILSTIFCDYERIVHHIYVFGQYFFGLLVLTFFSQTRHLIDMKYFKLIVEYVIWINLLLIIVGYLFDIRVFDTYRGTRYGYNGIFKSTATASYFYIFYLSYLLLKRHKSKREILLIIITTISSFFIGSKTVYIFVSLIFFLYIINQILRHKNPKQKSKYIYIYAALIAFILPFIILVIISMNSVLNDVYVREGFVTAFFSYRDVLFFNALDEVNHSFGFLNYLFGGVSYISKLTELALIDLLLTFGAIGTLVYIYIFYQLIPRVTKKLAQVIFLCILGVILFRGNFLYFSSVMYISLAIFTLMIEEINNKSNKALS